MELNSIEKEAVVLNAVLSMVDDMVNKSIFLLPGNKLYNTNLIPKNSESLRVFSILLRDFLSPVSGRGKYDAPFGLSAPVDGDSDVDRTTLKYVVDVCKIPEIGIDSSGVINSILKFSAWLEQSSYVEGVWLASIRLSVDLYIKRIKFIRMSGDINKHNILRLNGPAREIKKILEENGHQITKEQSYMVLEDCYDWFYEHLFSYHASNISEFLINIKYEIISYIEPIAKKQYRRDEDISCLVVGYSFVIPDSISNSFARTQYFELLSRSLRSPCFPRFSVNPSFKERF